MLTLISQTMVSEFEISIFSLEIPDSPEKELV
jgi:hypothetical protein